MNDYTDEIALSGLVIIAGLIFWHPTISKEAYSAIGVILGILGTCIRGKSSKK